MSNIAASVNVLIVTASGFLSIFVLAHPIGSTGQLVFGITSLALLLVIHLRKLDGVWRIVFFTTAAALAVRYVYWRTTSTLPPVDPLPDFVVGLVLFAAELFCIAMLALNMIVVALPRTRAPGRDFTDDEAPTVDVFVPSYDEAPALVAVTLAAARALDYPQDKLTVWLLDDGATAEKLAHADPEVARRAAQRRRELEELCDRLGCRYAARERNTHAKAGNLSFGLSRSRAELVVVFDADHVPARAFLRRTVGYFLEDARLFLVQTPHVFSNPDPIERNLGTFDRMPSENEMFYGPVQRGLDSWNASFFCGSAAVLRRAALEEAGGFSGDTITEDAETALALHARGWNSVYLDEPLVTGLQPETVASFIAQRSRWCRGMLQILILHNPLTRAGLSAAQRLCYLASAAFWLFPIPRLVFVLAPLAYLLFGLEIYVATATEFVAFTLVFVVAAILVQSYAYGLYRWPWVSEVYEYVQSVYLLPAILSVLRAPRRPVFQVTAKGETLAADTLSPLAWPYFALFALLTAGAGVTVARLSTEAEPSGLLWIVGGFNLFNLLIAGIALGVVSERREQRRTPRLPTATEALVRLDDDAAPGRITDASPGGFGIVLARPLREHALLGRTIMVDVADAPETGGETTSLAGRIVHVRRRAEDTRLGIALDGQGAVETRFLARIVYGAPGLLHSARALRLRRRSILVSTATVLVWGVAHAARGIRYALFRRTPAIAARPTPTP